MVESSDGAGFLLERAQAVGIGGERSNLTTSPCSLASTTEFCSVPPKKAVPY
jgi:hypothetical protein